LLLININEKEGEKVMQGNDNIYLEAGETTTESTYLIMQPGLDGTRKFFLQLQCNKMRHSNHTRAPMQLKFEKGDFSVSAKARQRRENSHAE
jgi:hypothetical protein